MRWLIGATVGFAFAAALATAFVWWDTAPAHTPAAKYRLGENRDLGLIVREAMKPGPELWRFECIGSEKDCGPRAQPIPAKVRTVPLPGTLWLILPGLAWLVWRRP